MNTKRQQIPLEVSSWMQKDLTLKRATANARMLTNDTRQNIVLSRKFFADLLNMSYARYRKIAEHEFEKKMFLRNQHRKTDTAMPGLRSHIEQLKADMNRGVTPRFLEGRRAESSLMCPSSQTIFSRPGTRVDSIPYRRPQPFNRLVQTAHIKRTEPTVTLSPAPENPVPPTTTAVAASPRPPTGRHVSRERLNRLAQPKGFRYKSAPLNQHPLNKPDGSPTAEEAFAQMEQISQIASTTSHIPSKPKSAVNDKRFQHLLTVFSEVYSSDSSQTQSCKQIVAANPSLQDDEGLWKSEHPSASSRKNELKQHRQLLAEKINRKVDVFLIEIGA